MTSKTTNEEYHCDREEPSAEPINLNNEEPEDLGCPNCCEPFSDSRPATPACPNPACPGPTTSANAAWTSGSLRATCACIAAKPAVTVASMICIGLNWSMCTM